MLNIKEEREYTQLRDLGQKLHIPIPEAFWTLEVFDKDGKLLQRHHQRSHSWVRNAYNLLFCQMAAKDATDDTFGAGKLSIKDTGGTIEYATDRVCALFVTNQTYGNDMVGKGYRGTAGDDAHGIVVGSGTDAENFESFVLQTPIANGVGSGQLSYIEGDPEVITWASPILSADITRYFNNNSGGNVSVNEVGIIAAGSVGGTTNEKWLQCRDKLASTVTVPDTGQLKVTYTVQLTYPA